MMWPFNTPNHGVKSERHDNPNHAATRRSAHAQFPTTPVKSEQVNANGNEHANVKGDPKPDARRHGGQVFMPSAVGQLRKYLRADRKLC
jgi:hypothetical protein